jgi:D-alanine-D-alanine ligase
VSRADFRYDDLMEGTRGLGLAVNARPGMTETSPVPAGAAGRPFEELVRWMVEDASVDR